jgi:hypothetical protein
MREVRQPRPPRFRAKDGLEFVGLGARRGCDPGCSARVWREQFQQVVRRLGKQCGKEISLGSGFARNLGEAIWRME